MSEYWKSLPRKFCDICKCWFADNKASIEFHERGKRHQENAQKRIQDIQKRGIKEFKKQQQLEDDMAKIEQAALAAYKKDLQNNIEAVSSNSDLASALLSNALPTVQLPKKPKVMPKKQKPKKPMSEKHDKNVHKTVVKKEPVKTTKWYEATSEEGHKYYYHAETSETQWDPPEEGFISIKEQETLASDDKSKTNMESSKDASPLHVTIKKEKEDPICSVGPQPKAEPYGQWTTIGEEKPAKLVDLQLPKCSEDVAEVVIPVVRDEPKLSIKEKVVGSLADSDPCEKVQFKKRKVGGSFKRNVRQRFDDD